MAQPGRGKRQARKQTVAQQIGVSGDTLSRKIEKVHRDDPGLSAEQAQGKAVGILKHKKRK
jgi:hypothetical protein